MTMIQWLWLLQWTPAFERYMIHLWNTELLGQKSLDQTLKPCRYTNCNDPGFNPNGSWSAFFLRLNLPKQLALPWDNWKADEITAKGIKGNISDRMWVCYMHHLGQLLKCLQCELPVGIFSAFWPSHANWRTGVKRASKIFLFTQASSLRQFYNQTFCSFVFNQFSKACFCLQCFGKKKPGKNIFLAFLPFLSLFKSFFSIVGFLKIGAQRSKGLRSMFPGFWFLKHKSFQV